MQKGEVLLRPLLIRQVRDIITAYITIFPNDFLSFWKILSLHVQVLRNKRKLGKRKITFDFSTVLLCMWYQKEILLFFLKLLVINQRLQWCFGNEQGRILISHRCVIKEARERTTVCFLTFSILLNKRILEQAWMLDLWLSAWLVLWHPDNQLFPRYIRYGGTSLTKCNPSQMMPLRWGARTWLWDCF